MKFLHLTCITGLLILSVHGAVHGQGVTIINAYQGDTTGRSLSDFRLKSTKQERVVINYYEPAKKKEADRLAELIGATINFYLDENIEVENEKIHFKKSVKEMVRDMNTMVLGAVKYYQYKEISSFKGFSKKVGEQLQSMEGLPYSGSVFYHENQSAAEKERQIYFFLQKELNDLKLLANTEVGNYSDGNLLIQTGVEEGVLTAAQKDSLLRLALYDPNATLPPVDGGYSKETLALLNAPDQSTLPSSNANFGDPLSKEILELLRDQNRKMDRMQGQIDQLRADQLAMMEAKQNARNEELQSQINDLRTMVIDLVKINSGSAVASSDKGLLSFPGKTEMPANLPNSIQIPFEKGMVVPGAVGKLTLNEVVDVMARNPQLKIIITGFADRTGNASMNLRISQQRAQAIKILLVRAGLDESRMVTRYLGDRDSISENPDDRKVVVEFIR